MAKAKKLPSGSWRVQVYAGTDSNGKRKYKSFTAETRREAEAAAAQWAVERKESTVSDMTLGEAYDAYIASKENVLSPSTLRGYNNIRHTCFPSLWSVPLESITPERVQIEINAYSKDHSPKSVRNAHGLLSAILRTYAPEIRLSTTLPQKEKTEIVVPTDNMIRQLVEAVKDTAVEPAVLMAAFGSLRQSEVCAVTEDDIDRQNNTVSVNKAMVETKDGEWVIKQPKSFAGYRVVSFPASIMERIRPVDMNPRAVYKAFRRAIKNNNLPDMRFHDLRHYQASILHALGVPDKYIMQRGGWTTDSTLKNIYQHTMADKQKEFDDIALKHFDSIIE